MPSPIVTATLQATALAALSNILAQLIDAHRHAQPLFALDAAQLLRFLILTVLTAPPNYYWQVLLERTFPGRKRSSTHTHDSSDDDADAIDLEDQRKRSDADNLLSSDPLTAPRSPLTAPRPPLRAAGAGGVFARLAAGPLAQGQLDWRNTALKWAIDCMTAGAVLNTLAFLVIMGVLKGRSAGAIAASVRADTWPIIWAGYKIWPVASIVSFACVPVERRIVWLSFVGLLWGIYLSLVAATV